MQQRLWLFIISYLLCLANSNAGDILTFAPSCQAHVIHRLTSTSQDFSYLEFYRDKSPCHLQGIIGGEHQTFIKILALQGDTYSVSFTSLQGDTHFSVQGEGINVLNLKENNEKIIKVEALESILSIEPYAYPYGEYQMIIRKL